MMAIADTVEINSAVTITLDHSSDCWSRSGLACTYGLEERLRWVLRGRCEGSRQGVAR